MICDFCSAENPRWRYPAHDIQVSPRAVSESDWMACDECARLIGNEDWDGLARQGLKTPAAALLRSLGRSDVEAIAYIATIHRAFRQARTGKPPYEGLQ